MEPDFVDEMIAKRAKSNPEFPAMVDAARDGRAERRAALESRLETTAPGEEESSEEGLVDEDPRRG